VVVEPWWLVAGMDDEGVWVLSCQRRQRVLCLCVILKRWPMGQEYMCLAWVGGHGGGRWVPLLSASASVSGLAVLDDDHHDHDHGLMAMGCTGSRAQDACAAREITTSSGPWFILEDGMNITRNC
jgi:hypothetical protein